MNCANLLEMYLQNRLVTLYDVLDTAERACAKLARLKAQAEEAMKVDRKNLDESGEVCCVQRARGEETTRGGGGHEATEAGGGRSIRRRTAEEVRRRGRAGDERQKSDARVI